MRKITKKTFFAIMINLFIFIAELVIIITNLPQSGGSALAYYTTLSNLTGMVSALIFLCSVFGGFKKLTTVQTITRYYATCMLSFTFIVVFCVLLPMAVNAGMNPCFLLVEDTAPIHHIINPILSFISFIFLEDKSTLKKTQPLIMLCLTLFYAFIMIFFNIVRWVDGPYPFFQIYSYPIWLIISWLIALSIGNYLLNFIIFILKRPRNISTK